MSKQSLTSAEHAAVEAANAFGLFIHFEGSAAHRTWKLYSRSTGEACGFYIPSQKRYRVRQYDGTSTDRDFVLRLASGMNLEQATKGSK